MAYQNSKKVYHTSGFKITKETKEQTDTRQGLTALYLGDLMDKKQLPWQKSFDPLKDKEYVIPYDVFSGKAYQGYQFIEICVAETYKGRSINSQYITWNDINKHGYRLKKGSVGIETEFSLKKDISYPVDSKTGRWTYTSIPTDHYIQYRRKVFPVDELQGKHDFVKTTHAINGIEFTKKLVNKINVPIIEEAGLKAAYYAPRIDEIHIGRKEDYPSEREYYGDLLRQSIRSLTKPGRVSEKGTEGFAKNAADIKFVRDKFRVELATMQMAIKTGLPYKPTLTDQNIKRIISNASMMPGYLLMMSRDIYHLTDKVESMVFSKAQEKSLSKEAFKEKVVARGSSKEVKEDVPQQITLKDYITKVITEGKMSDRQINEKALKGNFKELKDIPSDIKRRALINKVKKEVRAKVESRVR